MPSRDRVVDAVAVLTVLALLLRLVGLGSRPFHWDEARVGYWTLRYAATGLFEYRPVAGGPLLYVVGRRLFGLLGASDAVARLPVALVGGLLPAAALLFRDALDDLETGLLAAGLAVAPPLVYYSRFLRGDVLLAGFALAAVGCALRLRATDDPRYLYAGAVLVALAVASSGFVAALVLTWGAAALLTFDHLRVAGASAADVRRRLADQTAWVRDRATPLARAVLLALGVHVLAYAPRGFPGASLGDPTTWSSVVSAATVGSLRAFWGVRVLDRRYHDHELLPYLLDHGELLVATALPVVALGVVGFLVDRYDPDGPRVGVAFPAYWAGVGLFVVPVASEVSAPWTLVHTVTPMLVPAAVGAAVLLRYGRRAYRRDDAAEVAAAALLLVAVGVHGGVVLAGEVYGPSTHGNDLAQFGQPGDDLGPAVAAMERAVDDDGGVDVLWVGARFHASGQERFDAPPVPAGSQSAFAARLPLLWYVERAGATTDSVARVEDLPDDPPPVVIGERVDRRVLADRLPGYEAYEVNTGLADRTVVVFVETDG